MGLLFAMDARTLQDQRAVRRGTLDDRVAKAAEIVDDDRPAVIWCELNDEGDALERAIAGAVQVRGSDSPEDKARMLEDFAAGKSRVLVSKPSICGFGLNWQHCARMAFVGVTDSFEAYYQAVRRCWRFGQSRPVDVHVFASQQEGAVVANLKRKEQDAKAMADAMASETIGAVKENILGRAKEFNLYEPQRRISLPAFLEAA